MPKSRSRSRSRSRGRPNGHRRSRRGKKKVFVQAPVLGEVRNAVVLRNTHPGTHRRDPSNYAIIDDARKTTKANVLRASRPALRGLGSAECAARIYKCLMLPHEYEPVRYNSGARAQPTVLSSTFFESGVDFTSPQPDVDLSYPPPGQYVCYLMRHPLRASIDYDTNPGKQVYKYNANFPTASGGTINTCSIQSNGGLGNFNIDFTRFSADPTSVGYSPHGTYLYPLSVAGRRAIYIDGMTGTNYGTVRINQLTATDTAATITMLKLIGQTYQMISQTKFTTSSMLLAIRAPGYYAFEYYTTANQNNLITMSIANSIGNPGDTNGVPVWCHRTCQGVDDLVQFMPTCRVITATALLTFVGSTLNNAGTVTVAQVAEGAQWWKYTTFDSINNLENHQRWRWDKGCYAINLPTENEDWRLKRICETASVGAVVSLNDSYINPLNEPFVAIAVQCTPTDATSAGLAELRINQVLEYPTNNPMLDRRMAACSPEDWETVMKMLNMDGTSFCYENPLHFKDIIGKLLTVGKVIATHGPMVMRVLSYLAAL